jgi:predicted nuclease with TOPRIM domain
VNTERLAELYRAAGEGYWFGSNVVLDLLAEVERLTEALETVIRENAAGYDNLKRRLEQLREERDRLADALRRIADENDPLLGIGSEMEFAREALSSLPVREDAPQAEAGGGKSRRSGEGPH